MPEVRPAADGVVLRTRRPLEAFRRPRPRSRAMARLGAGTWFLRGPGPLYLRTEDGWFVTDAGGNRPLGPLLMGLLLWGLVDYTARRASRPDPYPEVCHAMGVPAVVRPAHPRPPGELAEELRLRGHDPSSIVPFVALVGEPDPGTSAWLAEIGVDYPLDPHPLQVLGMSTLDADELRLVWRKLAHRHHPDHGGDARTFARALHARAQVQAALARPPVPRHHALPMNPARHLSGSRSRIVLPA